MKLTNGLLAITLLFGGCGGSTTPAAEPGSATGASAGGAEAPPAREVTCYLGTTKVKLPNGQQVATMDALARRTVDPAASTIEEEVVNFGPKQQRYVVTMRVSGSTFTMTEKNQAFTGSGELHGEPWKWTSWHSTSNLPDGSRVESTDKVTAEGIRVEKTVHGPDDSVQVIINEEFQPIGQEECSKRFDALDSAPTPVAEKPIAVPTDGRAATKEEIGEQMIAFVDGIISILHRHQEDCDGIAVDLQAHVDAAKPMMARAKELEAEDPSVKQWFETTYGKQIEAKMQNELLPAISPCLDHPGVAAALRGIE